MSDIEFNNIEFSAMSFDDTSFSNIGEVSGGGTPPETPEVEILDMFGNTICDDQGQTIVLAVG